LAFPFTGAFVEFIHDVLVAEHMPYSEPIDPEAYRDRGALDSAVNRPFQTFGGNDLHPEFLQKAAALFHSIACNHCFLNGNKRTAVMVLDMFLTANGVVLLINNDDVYQLAKSTVEANQKGVSVDAVLRDLTARLEAESMALEDLRDPALSERVPGLAELYAQLQWERDSIRSHPLNNPRR
jgi:death on curing protein